MKRYTCWSCGADMGAWDGRYCDSRDTCGKPECEREARDALFAERDDAHDQLDRDMGWDWQ